MIQIDRAIVSLDIFQEHFLCDLIVCKGACCVEGDSGAPLAKGEAQLIEKYYPAFEVTLSEEKRALVKQEGFAKVDKEGEMVTPLYQNRECVYTYSDEWGITKCAIEKAFLEGKIDFRKPVSCHLYPIRITEYKNYDAVNYQQIDICQPGRTCGSQNQLPLYIFLKEPLIRKYGEKWYKELVIAEEYVKRNSKF